MFIVFFCLQTSNTLAWALYELSRHPETQERLAEEIEGALSINGRDIPEHDDLHNMPYLKGVIKETLRYVFSIPPSPTPPHPKIIRFILDEG